MANNTIEKALQRQREAAARQAAQQAESAQEDKKSSTIERTLEKQQAAKTDLPVETPVTEGQVKTKPTPAKSKPVLQLMRIMRRCA